MGKFAKQFCVNFSRVNIPCVTILEYTSTCYLRIIVLPFSNSQMFCTWCLDASIWRGCPAPLSLPDHPLLLGLQLPSFIVLFSTWDTPSTAKCSTCEHLGFKIIVNSHLRESKMF